MTKCCAVKNLRKNKKNKIKNFNTMKLLNFSGVKINEYIDVNLDLEKDLSIIVGTNGCGKTTSLNLIQAILLPKFSDIFLTPFDLISLTFVHKKILHLITVERNKVDIIFKAQNVTKNILISQLIIPKNIINEFDIYKYNKNGLNLNDLITKKNIDHTYLKFVNELQKPVFIGLERTNADIKDDYKDYLLERKYFLSNNKKDEGDFRNFKDNLGVSILETEMLVQSIYNRLKLVQERFFKSIQRELISSSFDFIEFDVNDFPTEVNIREKQNFFLERQSEIEDSLNKIGILDEQTESKLQVFFEKITKLFERGDLKENTSFAIEWLLNKSQIDKMFNLVKILDDYKLKKDETFLPIDTFLNIINSFFKDTGKKLNVDQVGRLFVQKPQGRPLTVDELSSGERQLIILFANVIFNKFKNKSNSTEILIIDEPEISLHIRWQEKFIDSLIEASNNTQFIIATHSPDIIGDYKFNTIKIQKK